MDNKIKYDVVKQTVLSAYESNIDVSVQVINGLIYPQGVQLDEQVLRGLGDQFVLKLNPRSLGKPIFFDDKNLSMGIDTRMSGMVTLIDLHIDSICAVHIGELASKYQSTIVFFGFNRQFGALPLNGPDGQKKTSTAGSKPKLTIVK